MNICWTNVEDGTANNNPTLGESFVLFGVGPVVDMISGVSAKLYFLIMPRESVNQ